MGNSNAELAAILLTEHARYRENPFSDPFAARAAMRRYWQEASVGQRGIPFCWERIASRSDLHIVPWEAH